MNFVWKFTKVSFKMKCVWFIKMHTFKSPGAEWISPDAESGIHSCCIRGVITIFGFSFGKFTLNETSNNICRLSDIKPTVYSSLALISVTLHNLIKNQCQLKTWKSKLKYFFYFYVLVIENFQGVNLFSSHVYKWRSGQHILCVWLLLFFLLHKVEKNSSVLGFCVH